MTLARKVETAILALFQADTTIGQIGPDLRHYFDNSVPRASLALVVHALPASNANLSELAGGAWWTIRVETMAIAPVARDQSNDRVDALQGRVEAIFGALTTTQINNLLTGDLAGFTVDGIVHEQPEDLADDTAIGQTYAFTLHGHT
jgi:hypothetical protein